MLKMGYKAGEALGKIGGGGADEGIDEGPAVKRRSFEPIKVVVKSDRQGLGQEEERRRRLDEIEQLMKSFKAKRLESDLNVAKDYLTRKKQSFQLRKLRHNLHKCQRICFQLDSEKKV